MMLYSNCNLSDCSEVSGSPNLILLLKSKNRVPLDCKPYHKQILVFENLGILTLGFKVKFKDALSKSYLTHISNFKISKY